MSDEEHEPVGSVGEEAAKLVTALQDWAREHGGEYADAAAEVVAGVSAGAAASFDSINEHIATDGKDCRYCPICQLISALRETSPELKQQLSVAATSFMHIVGGVLAAQNPDRGRKPRKGPGVEKIDLSDDQDWDEDP